MKIDKEDVITCGMIVLLCFAFFWIGYGYAVKKEVVKANDIVTEFMDDHTCIKKEKDTGIEWNLDLFGDESENT